MNQESVAALRSNYKANGYIPLPIENAVIGNRATGKIPRIKQWSERTLSTPVYTVAGQLNTGILLRDLYAIDFDSEDAELSDAVEQLMLAHLYEMPLKRFRKGSHRFIALYGAEGGQTKQKIGKAGGERYLEVLSEGQQFVADGLHWSGSKYEWRDNSPATFPKAELPLISPARMTAFLVDVKELFDAPDSHCIINGWHSPESPPDDHLGQSGTYSGSMALEDLDALLEALDGEDDRDTWRNIVAAIFNETGGSHDGMARAMLWSQKSKSYDRRGFDILWQSLRRKPLERLTAGTLLHHVRRQIPDWQTPTMRAAIGNAEAELAALAKRFGLHHAR